MSLLTSINNVQNPSSDLRKDVTPSFVFKKAVSDQEYSAIYKSRLEICQVDFPYILDMNSEYPAKDRFDDYSTLFYVTENNKVIASCRTTPYRNGGWEISSNLPDDLELTIDTNSALQLNRVYIEEKYRNQNLHAFMFYHFSEWVLKNTRFTTYFAICKIGLVRLYKNIGANLVSDKGFSLKGRGGHQYYIVAGRIDDFNHIIKNKFLQK